MAKHVCFPAALWGTNPYSWQPQEAPALPVLKPTAFRVQAQPGGVPGAAVAVPGGLKALGHGAASCLCCSSACERVWVWRCQITSQDEWGKSPGGQQGANISRRHFTRGPSAFPRRNSLRREKQPHRSRLTRPSVGFLKQGVRTWAQPPPSITGTCDMQPEAIQSAVVDGETPESQGGTSLPQSRQWGHPGQQNPLGELLPWLQQRAEGLLSPQTHLKQPPPLFGALLLCCSCLGPRET